MMTNYYDVNRQREILESLSGETLLTKTELYKSDWLPAYHSFANALLRNITVPETYTGPLEIRNLASYLRQQATSLGLEDDRDVTYTIRQVEYLSKNINSLEKGQRGEGRAHRAMFGIGAPNQILRNMEFVIDDLFFETDAIVINSKGICVVEVKNFHRNLVINDEGTLVAADDSNCVYCDLRKKNIRTQLNNAATVIRRALEQELPDNPKLMALSEHIHTVLFSIGGVISDSRHEITIADHNSIVRILNNLPGEETLNREEINTVANALKRAAQRNQYPIKWDYVRVAEAFAVAVAKLEYAAEHDPAKQFLEHLSGKKEPKCIAGPDADEVGNENGSVAFAPKKKRRYKKIVKKVATSAAGVALLGVGLLLGKNKF